MEGIPFDSPFFRWNGLLIMAGILIGGALALRESTRRGHDPEIVLDLFLPLLLWATVGARLWHLLTPPLSSIQLGLTTAHYFTHPLDAISIWIGGFGLPGAILGGVLALFLFCRKYQLNFWEWADILPPALVLAQIIGRLGNYFNQELYGLPTSMPWKLFISPEHRLAGYEMVEYYHPLFAYEMILNAINLFLLFWLSKRVANNRLATGSLFLVYLAVYSVIRFSLEFLKLDISIVGGLNINQVFIGVTAFVSIAVLYWRNRSVQVL